MSKAGIPLKFRKLTTADFPNGRLLFDYCRSEVYTNDLEEGRGVCLSGNPTVRSDLLAMMAKGTVLSSGRSTKLISLHSLVPILEHDTERRDFLQRADFLFVDWFEREFRVEGSSPYSFSQICDVEDFIVDRSRHDLPTYFAACRKWDQLTWWSKDFLGAMHDKVHDIVIP